jgi:tetratricopeptide (TPR) repeat protein
MARAGSDSARLRTLLGWSYFRLGEVPRAQAEFERSLRMSPRDPNAHYAHEGLGWIALKHGDPDRARAAFTEALRLSPGYHNALNGLGWGHLAKGDFTRAEASFQTALERVPGDAEARRGLGFVAYRRGDWRLAIERLGAVLRDNESDTLTRSALGWSRYYNGEYPSARQIFEDVARREPEWADPLLGFAWIAERNKRPAEAKAHFRAAIQKSAAYVAAGAPGASLRTLLTARPEWLDLWHALGWRLYHQRALALAEAEFRALLTRHPSDPEGLRGLGYTLHALKKYRESLEPLERAVAGGGSLPPVHERVEVPGATGLHDIVSDATSTLAWSHYHLGDYAAAQRLFRATTTSHPDWADAWSGLGWTLVRMGDRAGAESAFRRSLAVKPGYPDATAGLQHLGQRTR